MPDRGKEAARCSKIQSTGSSSWAVDVQDLENRGEEHKSFEQAIIRSVRIFDNASAASLALREFSDEASYKPAYQPTLGRGLSPTEETHFVQAYYRAITIVLLSCEGILESSIASWDMLDFQRVREALAFLFKDSSRSLFEHQSLCMIL